MQAIQVKYLGPTNYRGSRYKASCHAGSITVPTNYALNGHANARAAAQKLVKKVGWNVGLVGGTLESGTHVFVPIAKRKMRVVAHHSR